MSFNKLVVASSTPSKPARPKSNFQKLFESAIRGLEQNYPNHLRLVSNPPYIEDVEPAIQAYLNKIGEMQRIVQRDVCEIRFEKIFAFEAQHRFELSLDSVMLEFPNWGLDPQDYREFRYPGDFVTSVSAQFKPGVNPTESFQAMLQIRAELEILYDPIKNFCSNLREFSNPRVHSLLFVILSGKENGSDAFHAEYARIRQVREDFIERFGHIQSGVLSLSFVDSLVENLRNNISAGI